MGERTVQRVITRVDTLLQIARPPTATFQHIASRGSLTASSEATRARRDCLSRPAVDYDPSARR